MTLPHNWTDRDGIHWQVTVSNVRSSIQPDGSHTSTIMLTSAGVHYMGYTTLAVDTRTNLVPPAELQRILDDARRDRRAEQ